MTSLPLQLDFQFLPIIPEFSAKTWVEGLTCWLLAVPTLTVPSKWRQKKATWTCIEISPSDLRLTRAPVPRYRFSQTSLEETGQCVQKLGWKEGQTDSTITNNPHFLRIRMKELFTYTFTQFMKAFRSSCLFSVKIIPVKEATIVTFRLSPLYFRGNSPSRGTEQREERNKHYRPRSTAAGTARHAPISTTL